MADQKKSQELDPQKVEYISKLEAEKESMGTDYPNAVKLVAAEIDRVQTGKELNKLVELHHPKPTKLAVKVLIPVKQFPKFNFVGKLLGPKGNSLKRLQEETGAKIAILGRGSMKDGKKEDDLRKEGGKFAHLSEELHCLVELFGLPSETHQRMAHALGEIQRFLIPDNNDEIRQQQYEEMMFINGENGGGRGGMGGPPGGPPRGRGRGRGAAPPPRGRGGVGALLATPARNFPPSSRPPPSRGMPSGRGAPPPGRGAPPNRAPPPPSRSVPPLGRPSPMSRPPPPGRAPPPSRPNESSYDQDPYYSQPPPSTTSYPEDSYGGYEEPQQDYGTDSYNQSYSSAGQGETEYYDYGHGSSADDNFAGDSWNQSSVYGKSQNSRQERAPPARAHPYAAASAPRTARY